MASEGSMMAAGICRYVTAGVAIAGAGIWLATATGVPAPSAAPAVQLTAVDSVLPPPLSPPAGPCVVLVCGDLFGPSFATPTPPKHAASIVTPALNP
jgi:hypothetical protein